MGSFHIAVHGYFFSAGLAGRSMDFSQLLVWGPG